MKFTIERLITIATVLLVVVGLVLFLGYCRARDEARNADANRTLSDGRTAASADANDIRDAADERIAGINADVKDATDEIRATDDPVERSRVAERGLCRIDPSSSPNCRLLLADPR